MKPVDLLQLCNDIDLNIGDLVDGTRTRGVVLKKQAIYYRLRVGYGLSWSEIGDLCHKDHATIMSGVAAYSRVKDIIALTEALI